MHEKCFCFGSFFRNISKTVETILLKKKIEQNHGVLLYKKVLKIEHRKNYILRDISDFVKMSIGTFVGRHVS